MAITPVTAPVPNKYIIQAPVAGGQPVLLAADTLQEAIQDVFLHQGQGQQKIYLNSVEQPWNGTTYVPSQAPVAATPAPTPTSNVGVPATGIDPVKFTVSVALQNGTTKYVVFDTFAAAQADVTAHGGVGTIYQAGQLVQGVVTSPIQTTPLPPQPPPPPPPAPVSVAGLPALSTSVAIGNGDFVVYPQPMTSGGQTVGVNLYMDVSFTRSGENPTLELWLNLNGSSWVNIQTLQPQKVDSNGYNHRYLIPLLYTDLTKAAQTYNPAAAAIQTGNTGLALRVTWPSGHDQGANSSGPNASGGVHNALVMP
jgi:hypothetical protein